MATSYALIASSTVGAGGAANITFSSIPSTYTDLQIVTSLRFTTSIYYYKISMNGSTTAYSFRTVSGSGSAVNSEFYTSPSYVGMGVNSTYTANTFSNNSIYIPNYTSSNNKSISSDSAVENNATSAIYLQLAAALITNTSAITQITLAPDSGNFAQYSSAYLYGISKS